MTTPTAMTRVVAMLLEQRPRPVLVFDAAKAPTLGMRQAVARDVPIERPRYQQVDN